MKKMLRCKACGFLIEEGKYDECPACGVPSKMFEPFDDKVPENRRKWLEMHIHPVIVHAPQALGFLMLIVGALYVVLKQSGLFTFTYELLFQGTQLMAILLPLTTFGGLVSGMIDGRYRYKKITTILLIRKIIVGSVFLVLSIIMAVLAFLPGFSSELLLQVLFLLLNLAAFGCSALLGIWGAALNLAIMPGPFTVKKKPTAPPSAPSPSPAG